jgi:hypothetical protein
MGHCCRFPQCYEEQGQGNLLDIVCLPTLHKQLTLDCLIANRNGLRFPIICLLMGIVATMTTSSRMIFALGR